MLKVSAVAKAFDGDLLFSGVELVVNAGDRIGLVGPNGAGKTTLLRILAGIEQPSTGHVSRSPGCTLGYLTADADPAALDVGLDEYLRAGLGEVEHLAATMARLSPRLATDPDVVAAYGDALERWTALSGWTGPARLAEVRQRLDLDRLDGGTRLADLSGGEQARARLARALLGEPDLLILDEPTNHLDAEGIAWLGRWLAEFGGGVLVVSHDRGFLDRTVTRIVELDGIHTEPQFYQGGYREYRSDKDRRWARLLLSYEAQEKLRRRWEADIVATKGHALAVETTVRRGASAPGERRKAKKVARKAKVRERRLQKRLESARWLAQPQTRPRLTLEFPEPAESGLRASGLSMKVGGRTLFAGVDLSLAPGQRVLLSGRNGSGKSTLLRILDGSLAPDTGTVHVPAAPGLLPQTHDALRTRTTVLDFFRSRVAVYVDEAEELLDAHQFPPQTWDAPLRTLSEGELRRLVLATLVNSGSQLLLLDEPTNYLDFDALDVVEVALADYRGALVVVTHDTYFADRIGLDHRWQLDRSTLSESTLVPG